MKTEMWLGILEVIWGSQRMMIIHQRSWGSVGVWGNGYHSVGILEDGWNGVGSGRGIDLGLDGILAIGWES